MRIPKHDIPVKVEAPGAVARQLPDFGESAGTIGAEYLTMSAGTDLAPLLEGLDGNACQSVHWGYVISGDLLVSYHDGTTERCTTGDMIHWPAGHSVRFDRDTELVLFSPQADHTPVFDHILAKLSA